MPSIEEAIAKLTVAIEANTAILEVLTSKAKSAKAEGETTTAAVADKPAKAAAKGKAKADATDTAIDVPALKTKLKGWLFEFRENEEDPETEARGSAFEAALKKLDGATKVDEISAENLPRFVTWLDKQIAAGRKTPEPTADTTEETDDEDI